LEDTSSKPTYSYQWKIIQNLGLVRRKEASQYSVLCSQLRLLLSEEIILFNVKLEEFLTHSKTNRGS
jgi:hypothetical protein